MALEHSSPVDIDLVVQLGSHLVSAHYQFTTVTPLTHSRVLQNHGALPALDLREAFGWNLPFDLTLLPTQLREPLRFAGLLVRREDGLYQSQLRFGTLGRDLYAHSAYPTTQADAVFFGPDTYRFAALVESELAVRPLVANSRILDMGCGGGPGGMTSVRACAGPVQELVLADINPQALALSQANARLARLEGCCTFVQSDLFSQVSGEFDLIVSNPPYLIDAGERAYRHGGGDHGEGLSQRILEQSIAHLAPGGRLILYTGSAVVRGVDLFGVWAARAAAQAGCRFTRREIDPDVFGEELEREAYHGVDRIAAIGLVIERPAL